MSKIELWGSHSPRTMRVHWMLSEFNIEYKAHIMPPRTSKTLAKDFLSLNPKGKIPVFQHNDLILTESAAIINYISQEFTKPNDFYVPKDNISKSKINEWLSFACMELDATSIYIIRRHKYLSNIYGDAPDAVESAIKYFIKMTNSITNNFGNHPWIMPEGFSIADIIVSTCFLAAIKYEIDLPSEEMYLYIERIKQRPAYTKAENVNMKKIEK